LSKVKKTSSLILALMLIFVFNTSAMADSISDKKNQKQEHLNSKQELVKKKQGLEEEIKQTKGKISGIESDISKVNGEINTLHAKINGVQNTINKTSKELETAVKVYEDQDEKMTKRINSLYKCGAASGYLEILASSNSFSDFIVKADLMKKVINYDIDMLKELKGKREEIDRKKADLEKSKAELVAYQSKVNEKKNHLVNQNKEQKTLVAVLSRSSQEYTRKIQQEEAAAAKVDKEINQILKQIEEENRRKQAQNKGNGGSTGHGGNYNGNVAAILHSSDFPSGRPIISSGYGSRRDPFTGITTTHWGIDIATAGNTNIPVYSMAAGTVVLVRHSNAGYGNYVVIDHGSGVMSLYAHNNSIVVGLGDQVSAGQKIALSGSTGASTGPHVHFEVRINGQRVNPEPYLRIN